MNPIKEFPYEIVELNEDVKKSFLDKITENGKKKVNKKVLHILDIVLCGPKRYVELKSFRKNCWDLYNLEPRYDDVWLISIPRTGSTLTQEMIWLIANDLNFEKSAEEILDIRFPLIKTGLNLADFLPKDRNFVAEKLSKMDNRYLAAMEGRRFLKSHLPPSLLSPKLLTSKAKMIFTIRNPKDTIISHYHFYKRLLTSNEEELLFEDFFHLYKNNLVISNPFFEQVKEFWALKDQPNCLFLFYEETVKNLRGTLIKLSKFLEKELSEDDLSKLETHLSVDNFRKNNSVNKSHLCGNSFANIERQEHQFIRKGKVGTWESYFTKELNDEADAWIEANLRGTDIIFPF